MLAQFVNNPQLKKYNFKQEIVIGKQEARSVSPSNESANSLSTQESEDQCDCSNTLITTKKISVAISTSK